MSRFTAVAKTFVVLQCGLLVAGTSCGRLTADEPSKSEPTHAERLFALEVKPLFQSRCLACHGGDKEIKGGFRLTSRKEMLAGGDSWGTVVVPGKSQDSYLLNLVKREEADYEMPPKESEKLTAKEVETLRLWIDGGAPWPDNERVAEIYRDYAKGVTVQTSGGLSDDWTNRKYEPANLWAYQPWQQVEVPAGQSGIDYLISKKMQSTGLSPAGGADRLTLIRRASFDLLGLPPTPTEIDAFLADTRSDKQAFAALVDRLLQSPHYGEQWGRHWLDVVRYADSSGFANDWERPNAWRYRDYVVRSFNADKPYDQFVREQLAGDELSPNDAQSLIAAGFLRMGPWEHTNMSVPKVTRQQFLDDITDSVGQVFLAHALQCCRCHDHKFDPVPTRDYYAMQAVFATTQFADVDTEWLPQENRTGMADDRKYNSQRIQANQQMLKAINARRVKREAKWFADRGLPYKSRAQAMKAKAPSDQIPPRRLLETPDDYGQERIGRKWQTRLPWENDRYRPIAFTVYNGGTRSNLISSSRLRKPASPMKSGRIEKTTILTGGDPFTAGEPVRPGVLSAVPGGLARELTDAPQGRRSALADWIVDPDNPLPARVMVNRIWQYHFGRGIAGNPNNFGATGKKPTHPRLLDWLASEFVEQGWSIKHMHRIIMNSDAYRRSCEHPQLDKLRELDPKHESYARFLPRRLTAEELRDAMLAASGELNLMLGGIPARPDINLEAALQPRMIMGTFAPAYVPNPKPEQRNRRSLYAIRIRGQRDPFMEAFNQPGTEKSCELRDRSTISPQALTLLNGRETNERAIALANRLLNTHKDEKDCLVQLFRLAWGRHPSDEELAEALSHWQQMTKVQEGLKPRPFKYPFEVVRQAVDENTGKPFQFTEQLFVYRDYVSDLQPADVDARTRGLADLCLVILNANEFAYVY